jgi:hypothetical protein
VRRDDDAAAEYGFLRTSVERAPLAEIMAPRRSADLGDDSTRTPVLLPFEQVALNDEGLGRAAENG